MTLLSARQLSAELGLSERRIQELAQEGRIPSVPHMKNRRLFDLDAARAAIALIPKRDRREADTIHCYLCDRWLPRDAFLTITRRDKRCKRAWTGPASECQECRKELKREWRRRTAEAEGKAFTPRGDRAAWEAQQRALREEREAKIAEQRQRESTRRQDERRAKQQEMRERPIVVCRQCGETKPRGDFHPSQLARYACAKCRECWSESDGAKFRHDRETLSDSYVKRQLTKHSDLVASQIPPAMVEAKRVQLMLERVMPTEPERYGHWLSDVLKDGPVDAELLGRMAISAGFSKNNLAHMKFRSVRRAVAAYDETNREWRLK